MPASFPSNTPYGQGVTRVGAGFDVGGTNNNVGDALVPEPLSTSIIQELPKKSAALALCKKTMLSTKTERMPVLDVLPMAYWVGGDTGLKQTSQQQWKNVVMVVEELATIIPIPQAYLDDADVPIWDEVQPRMVEAAGNLIDQAVIFDVNKPSTWGTSIYGGAINAGNVQVQGGANAWGGSSTTDLGQDVASLGDKLAQTGYTVNGFVGRPGLNWQLAGLRSAQGVPIYNSQMTDMSSSSPLQGSLYGFPISMVDNGAWEAQQAQLIAGDFSKAIIGVRQDITFKLFTEGVISDASGAVVLNLMQQDAVAMRMVMRLAYATVNPQTIMTPGKGISQRWPFGVIVPAGHASSTATARTDTVSAMSTTGYTFTDASAVTTDVGKPVTATGIPAGTYVTGVSGTTVTISQLPTATTTSVTIGGTYGATSKEEAGQTPELEQASGAEQEESSEEESSEGQAKASPRSRGRKA